MHVFALQLRDFRSWEQVNLELSPSINLISGPNAQGKTSLLEALYLAVSGRSFRTSQISDLIRFEQPLFYVEIRFVKNEVEQRIRISYGEGERKILYNSTACQSAASLLGIIPGVVTTSDDISLVRGAPQLRRQFLDVQIAQTDPLYLHHLTRYQRAMRQRNNLLRQRSLLSIESWEAEMTASAIYLVQSRTSAVQKLLHHSQKRYERLSYEGETFHLSYKSSAPMEAEVSDIKDYFLRTYREQRPREMQLGLTLVGPHRDDLTFSIDNREVRSFGSEGQQRCYITALRLGEYDCIQQATGIKPLMIFDDFGVSLDLERSQKLYYQLADMGQVFLTSTQDLSVYCPSDQNRTFTVMDGIVHHNAAEKNCSSL